MDRLVIHDRVFVRHSKVDLDPVIELHADRGARGSLRRLVTPQRKKPLRPFYEDLRFRSWEGWYRCQEPGLYLAHVRRGDWRHYWVIELRQGAQPTWRVVAEAGLVRDLVGAVEGWFGERKETAIA